MEFSHELYSELYDFLFEWHENAVRTESINPYFATRFKNDSKFKEGRFFQGNDDYIAITFWTGSDYINKTPNIYYEIHRKFGLRALMVGRDSELKARYFERMANDFNWASSDEPGVFIKHYDSDTSNYKKFLEEFLSNDKIRIDEYIKLSIDKLDEDEDDFINDEYSSKFGFISSAKFDEMVTRVAEFRKRREREERLTDQKTKSRSDHPEMPYALESMLIGNYHDIRGVSVENLPTNSNWVFLTGMNGFGKTSVLQAIALGLTDFKTNAVQLEDKDAIQIGFIVNTQNEVNSTKMYGKKGFKSLNDYVAGYGPSRLLVSPQDRANEDKEDNIISLFEPMSLKNIDYELGVASKDDRDYFEQLKELISKATDGFVSDIKVEKGLRVLYRERLNEKEYADWLPRTNLSAGYRSMVHLVGDILIRLYKKEVHSDLSDITGIVLIDEIENHLHPSLQKKAPELLTRVFPKIQFIASTHSPIPILGAPKHAVILKIVRDGNGTSIHRLDDKIYIEDLLPNTILSSPIFDLEDISHSESNEAKALRTENSYNEVEFNDRLKKKIDEFLTGEKEEELVKLFNSRRKQ